MGGRVVVAHPVMDWLAAGVPLSLLMDLAGNGAPNSEQILRTETTGRGFSGANEASRRLVTGLSAY